MKAVVVYKSKTGFAKTYAQWIADELKADIFDLSEFKADSLNGYDAVIFGGGLYAVGINGIGFVKSNLPKLEGKKVAVFATGATPFREEAINEVRDKNFTPEELEHLRFFYMRGGFDYNKLKLVDRFLMKLLKRRIRSKEKKNIPLLPDERGMLAAYDRPLDFTGRENIEELVKYIGG